jgi:hypothetical protein
MYYSIRKLECNNHRILHPLGQELSQPNRFVGLRDITLCNVVCRFIQIGYMDQYFCECALNAVINGGVKWLSTSGVTEFLCGFLTAATSNGALYDPLLLNATSTKRLMFSQQYHWQVCAILFLRK